jgi:serine protease AprX
MRPDEEKNATVRSSAIWTKPDETRSSALWGKGGRGFIGALALIVALMAPATGFAHGGDDRAVVPKSLLSSAEAHPWQAFDVIVQGDLGHSSRAVAKRIANDQGNVRRTFRSISGVSARMSGRALLALAHNDHILAITPDALVFATQEATSDPLATDPLATDPLATDPLATDTSGTSTSTDTSGTSTSTDTSGTSGSTDTSGTSTSTDTSGTSTSTDTSGTSSSTDTSGTSDSTDTSTTSGSSDTSTTSTAAPMSAYVPPPQNGEMWRETTHVDAFWSYLDPLSGLTPPQAPAIAIVDSGVDASRLEDFGGRVVAQVNLSSLAPGAIGDDQGHGTMVAGVAAGASPAYPGVAQNAPLVSVRTSDANGQSMTSDVIAAADWILANKDAYNIRVANFSLAGSVETSFRFDPLDKAVERLWFAGVVVVAASGNHGTEDGADVSMSYAPGNDPFIITVGGLDQQQTSDPYDDSVAWWSGKGYTMDGFYKPDMAAPGRYMVMPVPMDATVPNTVPERVVAPGYMWMSGTSFSAPIVAGAAAELLARHPDWGPDEVKGALMLSATYLSDMGAGVGGIDASVAASFDFTPPNPNENFYAFVETDPTTGYRFFNEASWASHVATEASWSSANWASASWASASWASANWASASWSSANWSSNVESSMTSTANWNTSAKAE